MNTFEKNLAFEIRYQEKKLRIAEERLPLSPPGSLSERRRKNKTDFYHNIEDKKSKTRRRRQLNISNNQKLILQLTDKLIQQKTLHRSRKNLFYLKKLQANYQPTSIEDVSVFLGTAYRDALSLRRMKLIEDMKKRPYPKAPFDPRYHIHETDSGELVRSKSEQIILNTLYAYPLVVHYEEEFLYKNGVPGINRCYPDFTIILPDGSRIIWEHLGRLDDPEYCRRVAIKLNLYQQNGYVIGKNLILTMDDDRGNISSALVIDAIEHYILPQMEKRFRLG